MKKIMIATDLGPMKEEVIQTGLSLARQLQAEVVLLAVINRNLDFFPPDTGIVFADQWEARQHLAQEELNVVKNAHPDLTISVLTPISDPQEEVVAEAAAQKCDMLIVGTHGRTGLSQFVMGSTAEYVVRHSIVPVLVIPYNKTPH